MLPEQQMEMLSKMKFNCVHSIKVDELSVETLSNMLVNRREKSEFEVDGIVVAHNKMHQRAKENPKYAFAFKSVQTMSKAEVIVTHVEWNISKDGYLIPVINFEGISLNGVTIKRDHGFNGKFIKDNVIGPGSKIMIMRSGDVIPYVESIVSQSSSGKPQMPDVDYIWSSSGVDIIQADMENDEVVFKNLEYFFKKIEFVGLGAGNLRKIFDAGYKTVYDILNISKQQLALIDTFKDKMATKIYDSIQQKKANIDCITMMDASNMLGRGIGSKKLALIVEKIPTIITRNYVPTKQELLAIKGIEDKTATTIINGLPKYREFVKANKLECYHQTEKENVGQSSSSIFTDQVVVFTGFRSKPLEEFINNNGGTVTLARSLPWLFEKMMKNRLK
jgi:NAD-dependent DNA ligase